MIRWNVRVNWQGKLILRRFIECEVYGKGAGFWRDATTDDLRKFYDDTKGTTSED